MDRSSTFLSHRAIRILFLSDSHLGFNRPVKETNPQSGRSENFFHAFDEALEPALRSEVDAVIHGGDLFFRSRIPVWLTHEAITRIKPVSDRGIPFIFVPGNHERSWITHPILWHMENVYVFAEPGTIILSIREVVLSISAFPFQRGDIRDRFRNVLNETAYQGNRADIRLLCMHQIVEGARVGPGGYRFMKGPQVIRRADIPDHFAVVLAGHIHRHQVLNDQRSRDPYTSAVVYAGSTGRTSRAEIHETKGFIVVDLIPTDDGRGSTRTIEFRPVRTGNRHLPRVENRITVPDEAASIRRKDQPGLHRENSNSSQKKTRPVQLLLPL